MADTDILTLDEGIAAIHSLGRDAESTLERLITSVSDRIDTLCGPVVNRSVVEYHDGLRDGLLLRQPPVSSITTVVERQGTTAVNLTAEVWNAPTANDFHFDTNTGLLYRRSGGWNWGFYCGSGNIVVTYVAGRCSSTLTVPARFKDAAAITLSHIWKHEHGAGSNSFGTDGETNFGTSYSIPNKALELVAADRLPVGIA